MSPLADLTRWNRAGLRRFRYIEGNAADYLELLRSELTGRFPDWTAIQTGGPDLDAAVQRRRVLAQYHGERRDYAWEIARSFARAAHVLGEHIDAFANEGFIDTATQWDLLRKLVEMLGYHPAPPASASTVFALKAKPGTSGSVAAGFQVKYAPASGAAPVVFETLADIIVDERLNELRPVRWDRSEELFDPFEIGTTTPWRKMPEMELSVGQPALLLQQPDRNPAPGAPAVVADVRAVELSEVDNVSNAVAIVSLGGATKGTAGSPTSSWRRGYAQLLAGPKKAHRPHLNGPGLVQLDRPHGLGAGEIIAWSESGVWKFNAVTAVDATLLRVQDTGMLPGAGVYRAVVVPPVMNTEKKPPEPEFRTPLTLLAAAYRAASGSIVALNVSKDFQLYLIADKPAYYLLNTKIDAAAIYVVLAGAPALGRVVPTSEPAGTFRFDGGPAGLASGDWVIADYRDAAGILVRSAARIARIEAREDDFRVELLPADSALAGEVPADMLQALIRQVRRIEAILDQPTFNELRLEDLTSGAVGARSVSTIQGIGQRGATTASYADRLAAHGLLTVRDLARLPAIATVEGVPATRLREFRTHAEQLVAFATEAGLVDALLGTRLAAIVAMESKGTAPGAVDVSAFTLERLHGPFRYTLNPLGYDRNSLALPDRAKLLLALASDALPTALKAGRMIVVEQEGDARGNVHQTTFELIDVSGPYAGVQLAEPLPEGGGFTLGNTIVRANAVRAGHGEAKGERLLGSGNAALLNQEFVFEVAGVSFVSDSTMPSGVRADISVVVDTQVWQPVASLRDSGPADPDYTVQMTEEGYLRIGFGDGENGRRLPTGANNVRVRYRAGSGLAGNLAPGSLEKPAKPTSLIAAVSQPLPALGGNDLETVAALRESAPASLLTLERAVALSDYANLAVSQSSVWQAAAFAHATSLGRHERIEVVIVPASGAPLDENIEPQVPDDFLSQQRDFLLRHAPPGITVAVNPFEPVLIDLSVTVRVKFAEYDPTGVVERVRASLLAAFGLQRRRLGQALQRSEVYNVVEDVEGVENSDCEITLLPAADMAMRPQRVVTQSVEGRELAQTIIPLGRQVVYLDPDRSSLKVTAAEYEL